tara:strand:- start:326 stop:934 length:609 start_codon:yes stop_codon:yes gene_type:complete
MDRIEYKIDIDKSKKIEFLNFLKENKYVKLHENRVVNSIYFDNLNFEIYNDSIEGLSPRKKIRLRYYGEELFVKNKTKTLYETKFTKFSGRSKETKPITNVENVLNNGVFDNRYGVCYPKTIVSYVRSYYSVDQFRVTLDENLSFSVFDRDLLKKNIFFSDNIIVEIKNNNIQELDNMKKIFPFKETRFSKYCQSIEALNLC